MLDNNIIIPEYLVNNSEETIAIPSFLSNSRVSAAACAWCVEVACETDAMTCGECSGQGCPGQCDSAQCGSSQCGSCQNSCQSTCEDSCQSTCEKSSQYPTASGSISIIERGPTYITIRLSSIPKATSYTVAYRPTTTTSADTVWTTSLNVTIDGLEPNTTYVFNYYGENDYGTGPYMSSGVSATTTSLVEPWSWSSSNGSATDTQTQDAYTAITNQGLTSNFSYKVWNDLVDKVYEVLDASGDSWNTTYASYSATRMSSSDKILTAIRFNSLRIQIGSHVSTGITEKSAGEQVLGSYFTTLTDCLNQWIDNL